MNREARPPTVLVLAPMPAFPTSAGNRARLVATCDALRRGGFAVDFAYLEHEDQIYRRFGQQPPTDVPGMAAAFQRLFLIPVAERIPLKTQSWGFPIDAWCPDEAVAFVDWYFETHPETCAIVVNYVFLSRCLEAVPDGVARIIDTHDRFADRQLQYLPFRSEPNFFYTDRTNEALGLARADTVLAIQPEEAAYFRTLADTEVRLLPPRLSERRAFKAPQRIETVGFIGHGNDANLFSIGKFVHAWAAEWQPGLPTVLVAGEICTSLGKLSLPGVRLVGYVDRLETFYEQVDAVVAPMLMGTGLKIKVAEALSMGKPVIGTRIAFDGFETRIPPQQLTGTQDCVAMIRALHAYPSALAELTQASEELATRFDTRSATCEAEWLAALPRRPGQSHVEAELGSRPKLGSTWSLKLSRNAPAWMPFLGRRSSPQPARLPDMMALPPRPGSGFGTVEEPTVARSALGSVLLTHARSLGSAPGDPDFGVLVATEKPAADEARAAGYTPMRRRWFARPLRHGERADGSTSLTDELSRAALSLAPEWVRERALPRSSREALAAYLATMRTDWTAQARLIGHAADIVEVAASLPSFLLRDPRQAAAFLIDEAGAAREMRLTGTAPLARSTGLGFTGADDLTPAPGLLTLAPTGEATPIPMPVRILVLTDDLTGQLTLGQSPTLVGRRSGGADEA